MADPPVFGMQAVQMLNKVPAITLAFWVAKTFATTVGETAADYLNSNLRDAV